MINTRRDTARTHRCPVGLVFLFILFVVMVNWSGATERKYKFFLLDEKPFILIAQYIHEHF